MLMDSLKCLPHDPLAAPAACNFEQEKGK